MPCQLLISYCRFNAILAILCSCKPMRFCLRYSSDWKALDEQYITWTVRNIFYMEYKYYIFIFSFTVGIWNIVGRGWELYMWGPICWLSCHDFINMGSWGQELASWRGEGANMMRQRRVCTWKWAPSLSLSLVDVYARNLKRVSIDKHTVASLAGRQIQQVAHTKTHYTSH